MALVVSVVFGLQVDMYLTAVYKYFARVCDLVCRLGGGHQFVHDRATLVPVLDAVATVDVYRVSVNTGFTLEAIPFNPASLVIFSRSVRCLTNIMAVVADQMV